MRTYCPVCVLAFIVTSVFSGRVASAGDTIIIPEVAAKSESRLVTTSDMSALRRADLLEVSPDGSRFAVLVRQGDAATNTYRMSWFVGSTESGLLRGVGDGGEASLAVSVTGDTVGAIERRPGRWSPDGQWIAYARKWNDQVQIWRSKVDGSVQQQLTHNAADVVDFAWRPDGQAIVFRVGLSREELQRVATARDRRGYRYDDELNAFTDFMLPQLDRLSESPLSLWVVSVVNGDERPGGEPERADFEAAQARYLGGSDAFDGAARDSVVLPAANHEGALTWLVRASHHSSVMRVMAKLPSSRRDIVCSAPECVGPIIKAWWSHDGRSVVFWRREGLMDAGYGFYAWSPGNGSVRAISRTTDEYFQDCAGLAADSLICIRETPTRPTHIVSIRLATGAIECIADINPEFTNIRLGRVERIEWDTPRFAWNEPTGALAGTYPRRTFGYVLYPPTFDPTKKYPVFVSPYAAIGFDNQTNMEHPLHVYAANGFVVLSAQLPMPRDLAPLGPAYMKKLYSAELGFPHLTMLSETILGGLDELVRRNFVDTRRVGMGGVSHGTMVPLYLMQHHNRIAALSISSATRGAHEYYWTTPRGRMVPLVPMKNIGYEDWIVRPEGEGREFWRGVDISDHVDSVNAPILMNIPSAETYGILRFIRHLGDAGKPYDAYIFPNETHIKWQPTHLSEIMNRNLDWFRFWLQDYEDGASQKAEQYAVWRKLRRQADTVLSGITQ